MSDEELFYIFSVKWTRHVVVTWWRPNASGYTQCLDQAGRYTGAETAKHTLDPDSCVALPCDVVDALAVRAVFDFSVGDLVRAAQEAGRKAKEPTR